MKQQTDNTQDNNLFILSEDFNPFKKGSLVLKGSEITKDGQEYFDMTTEINLGHSYSVYNIPDGLLLPPSAEDIKIVRNYLSQI